jgi:type IV pilus assembly protein PilV
MRINKTSKPQGKQSGMLLIEVLVALLLFAVGILGLVKAMAFAQAAQSDAQVRSDAAQFASEIVQTIWLTAPRGSNTSTFNTSLIAFEHQPSGAGTCAFSGTASSKASVTDWVDKVQNGSTANGNADRLPGATAAMQQITVGATAADFNRVTVTLCWKGPNDAVARQHVYSAYVNENF